MNWLSCVTVTLLLLVVVDVKGISWHQDPNTSKCLHEEIKAHELVSGEYQVSDVLGQRIDYIIKDSKDHVLSQKEDIPHVKPGKFSFYTETVETFRICFTTQLHNNQRGDKQSVTLDIKRGIEAKNYEGISEAAKFKPIEVELKRLEDLSETIVRDFAGMRENEEHMRDTNEQTNARVFYFSIFSMCCLVGLATWQLFYLRRFFRAKKLIE